VGATRVVDARGVERRKLVALRISSSAGAVSFLAYELHLKIGVLFVCSCSNFKATVAALTVVLLGTDQTEPRRRNLE